MQHYVEGVEGALTLMRSFEGLHHLQDITIDDLRFSPGSELIGRRFWEPILPCGKPRTYWDLANVSAGFDAELFINQFIIVLFAIHRARSYEWLG